MKKTLIALTAICALYACKKETDTPSNNNNTTVIPEDQDMKKITAKPWLIYKAESNGINVWNLGAVEKCQKDDTYKFFKDSVLRQYDNVDKCSGTTDSTDNEWYFYNNKKQLVGYILGLQDTADIVSLTETELTVSLDYNGMPLKIFFKNN